MHGIRSKLVRFGDPALQAAFSEQPVHGPLQWRSRLGFSIQAPVTQLATPMAAE